VANEGPNLERTEPGYGDSFSAELRAEIGSIAQLACVAAGASGCLLLFHDSLAHGVVWAERTRAPLQLRGASIAELIERWVDGRAGAAPIIHHLRPSDAAILRSLGIEIEESVRTACWRYRAGPSTTSLVLVSVEAGKVTDAAVDLAARCACAVINDRRHSQQASFWRTQAATLRDGLTSAQAQSARTNNEYVRQKADYRRLAANAERGNVRALASALSREGPFEGWMIIAQERDAWRVTDSHAVACEAPGMIGGELRRALRRQVIAGRNLGSSATLSADERTFRDLGYRGYLCVPLDSAAAVLLSRNPVRMEARRRVADRYEVIRPHLKNLILSHELERQRALVRNLARGLFATADAERASMRRDLHDDWAQLLAAAKIAVNGNSADARRFFGKLEGELRKRLDALRPPQSRGTNLKRTIEAEVGRLAQAGIEASASIHGLHRLPTTIREVFMRVIGEGVSNVIRHADANRVLIEVECHDGVALAAVRDNGPVLDNGGGAGFGLRGLAERVGILGGSCKLESRPGNTRLCARIPVADL